MSLSSTIRTQLIAVGNSNDEMIDLAKTALVLASADRPGVSIKPYLRHIDQLSCDVKEYVLKESNSYEVLNFRIEALVQVIARRYGYGGSEAVFDDLNAANLMRVIDSRSGLPIAIGILFIVTARAQGWAATGVDFPGRFLVRLDAGGLRKIIDPFADGAIIEAPEMRAMFKAFVGNHVELTPEHYREMGNRDILVRLQGNIKNRLIQREKWTDALNIIETMLLFQPEQNNLWHEAGLLYARTDRIVDAIRALEKYLSGTPAEEMRYKISLLLQELRTRLN